MPRKKKKQEKTIAADLLLTDDEAIRFAEDVHRFQSLKKAHTELSKQSLDCSIKVGVAITSTRGFESALPMHMSNMIEARGFQLIFLNILNDWFCAEIAELDDKIAQTYGIRVKTAE